MLNRKIKKWMSTGFMITAITFSTLSTVPAAQQTGSGEAGVGAVIEKKYVHNQQTQEKSFSVSSKTGDSTQTTATVKKEETSIQLKPIYSSYKGWAAPAVKSFLNVRSVSSSSGTVVGKLKKGSIAKVIKKGKKWSKVQSGKVRGYVYNEYLVWDKDIYQYAQSKNYPKKAIVTAQALKVRQKPSTDAKVLSLVFEQDSYKIISENRDWVKVKVDGQKGYLSKDYIQGKFYFSRATPVKATKIKTTGTSASKTTAATEAEKASTSPENNQSASLRKRIVNYALQYIGNPYVYGGESLTRGADCSGFTMKVYAHFGYSLSHGSSAQSGEGREISISSIRPGDLLFYKRGGRINHVTMYIGNGKVVHASNSAPYPKGGIKISGINYRTPCKAVRIIR